MRIIQFRLFCKIKAENVAQETSINGNSLQQYYDLNDVFWSFCPLLISFFLLTNFLPKIRFSLPIEVPTKFKSNNKLWWMGAYSLSCRWSIVTLFLFVLYVQWTGRKEIVEYVVNKVTSTTLTWVSKGAFVQFFTGRNVVWMWCGTQLLHVSCIVSFFVFSSSYGIMNWFVWRSKVHKRKSVEESHQMIVQIWIKTWE